MAEFDIPVQDGFYLDAKGRVWQRDGEFFDSVSFDGGLPGECKPFRKLVVDEWTLTDATSVPAEGEVSKDVGEFAAQWNAMPVHRRAMWFDAITSNANWAHRCFIENHDGSLAVLQSRLREREAASDLEVAEAVDRAMIRRDMELRAQYGDVHVRSLIVEVVNEVIGRG